MLPFAYQVLVISYDEVELNRTFPRFAFAYGCLTEAYPPSDGNRTLEILACYPDGTSVPIPIQTPVFRTQVDLDMEALREEAKQMIAKDAERQAAFFKTIKGSVTGSPWLCDMGEDWVVNQLAEQRQWRWKREEEIDWPVLEGWLERKG